MAGWRLARIAAAHSAALVAPAAPIANVATGTPAGICTMDSSESSPPRDFDCTGTPSTGRIVLAAVMPGRCAAPPAPAISTSSPDRKSTRLNSSHGYISYAVFCLKKKKKIIQLEHCLRQLAKDY